MIQYRSTYKNKISGLEVFMYTKLPKCNYVLNLGSSIMTEDNRMALSSVIKCEVKKHVFQLSGKIPPNRLAYNKDPMPFFKGTI